MELSFDACSEKRTVLPCLFGKKCLELMQETHATECSQHQGSQKLIKQLLYLGIMGKLCGQILWMSSIQADKISYLKVNLHMTEST